jgi:hypothetical protein
MKANELRIGNYINYINETITVDGINDIDVFNSKIGDIPLHCVFGIELTKEWLIKFGFTELSKNVFLYDRFKILFVGKYNFWYVNDKKTNVYLTKVEFVHELQNFVFIMNGTELELKHN